MRLCRLGSSLCAIAISSGNFTCFLRNKTQGVEMYRKGRSAHTKGGMFLSMDATLLGGMRRIADPLRLSDHRIGRSALANTVDELYNKVQEMGCHCCIPGLIA